MRSSPVRGSVPAFADGRATARVCIRPAIVRGLGKPPGLRSGPYTRARSSSPSATFQPLRIRPAWSGPYGRPAPPAAAEASGAGGLPAGPGGVPCGTVGLLEPGAVPPESNVPPGFSADGPSRPGLTNRQGPSGRQGLPSRPEAGPRSPAGRRSGRSGRRPGVAARRPAGGWPLPLRRSPRRPG